MPLEGGRSFNYYGGGSEESASRSEADATLFAEWFRAFGDREVLVSEIQRKAESGDETLHSAVLGIARDIKDSSRIDWGLRILKHALREPARQLAENSGEDGGVVIHEMRAHEGNWGYDAAERKYVDLVEAGVIDPTKVVRLALENAASAATLLLLSEATLTEVQEEREPRNPMLSE